MGGSNYVVKDVAGKLAVGFLKNPLTSILGVFLIFLGYLSLVIMPREEDPQIAISGGTVIVAMPGATPKEIENVIIKPLERKLREIRGIEHIYGTAMHDVGMVNVMYYIGENREDSNLKLYDKVMQNMDLMPQGVMQPLIKPFDIDIDVPIMSVGFYLKEDTNTTTTQMIERVKEIQHKFNSVDNVAKTTLQGAHKEQFNVYVDAARLTGYNLSMGQIMMAIKSLAVNVPDVKGKTQDNKLVVFGIENAINTEEDIRNVIVAAPNDSPIYLKDVAHVERSYDKQNYQDVKLMQRTGEGENSKMSPMSDQVILSIAKLAGKNAVFVSQDVENTLKSYEQILEKEGIGYIITRNYGERANEAVNELMSHLVITIVIIAIMLIFALGWRESIIVTFTVPAILSITLFVAYLSGQTINRITLFAFLLSLGLLVDAAIIVIENIHRHLHGHHVVDKTMDEIVVEATDEIGAPTNVATLAIILTMVPMAFVGGMMGSFMKPIPYNVPVALLASLVVAYIFTPYLSRKLLSKPTSHHRHH